MEQGEGAAFLNKKYPEFQHSRGVERAVTINQERTGDRAGTGGEKIQAYLDRLENIVFNDDKKTQERASGLLRSLIHRAAIINREDVPEQYLRRQFQQLEEEHEWHEGGDFDADQERERAVRNVQVDQIASLDEWLNYLGTDNVPYPTWFRYYTLRSVLGMSNYDPASRQFGKRSKGTINPFPDLNIEALSYVYDTILHSAGDNPNRNMATILNNSNFSKLYASEIEKNIPTKGEKLSEIEGEWVEFTSTDEAEKLARSVRGHNTGWCIVGKEASRSYLASGDFYVYYSNDRNGRATIPRVAINTIGGEVDEIFGINPGQTVEDSMFEIAFDKFISLPGGEKAKSFIEIKQKLQKIEDKVRDKKKLTQKDIAIIYGKESLYDEDEVDNKLWGFCIAKERKIQDLRKPADFVRDMERMYGIDDLKELSRMLATEGYYGVTWRKFLNSIDEFPALDRQVAIAFVKDSKRELLVKYRNKFDCLKPDGEVKDLMAIGDYLRLFKEIDDDLAQALLKGVWYRTRDELINNLGLFSHLSSKTVYDLIGYGYEEALEKNLASFDDFDEKFAKDLIYEGHLSWVVDHFSKFKRFGPDMASYFISHNLGQLVAKHVEKYSGLDQSIAEQMIKDGRAKELAENINSFSELDYRVIFQKIIEAKWGYIIINFLDKFRDIDYNWVAIIMIAAGLGKTVVKNIGKFSNLSPETLEKIEEYRQ